MHKGTCKQCSHMQLGTARTNGVLEAVRLPGDAAAVPPNDAPQPLAPKQALDQEEAAATALLELLLVAGHMTRV
jgi:hypothetical protein